MYLVMEFASTFSYDIFLRLTVAMLLGLAIGAERIYAHKAAGMRTYAMVAMGSSLFIVISQVVASYYSLGATDNGAFDPLRMASQIIVGVGFLGSGLIVFKDDKLSGVTTASGLSYEIKVVGTGEVATEGSKVSVHYVGTLENGSKFDSSRDRGTPFSFNLGASQVIRGWDEGVAGMKVGETRILTIPSDLAYGPSGIPGVIPGGATLIFEVELLAVE